MKVKCEHPVLIFNPNIVWLVSVKCKTVVLRTRTLVYNKRGYTYTFPWHDFYAAKEECTPDTIDDYYMVDDDGVVYPVFMYVPCGKCRLCREHKVDEWSTRCMCESATSPYTPLFITLTYKPECRPDNMIDVKDDFQRFMKRLRIAVSRDLGIKNRELRYMAVSEYTPKNHYPHLHMLLWNMPYVSAAEGALNSFQALVQFIADAWSNGFVKVEFCRDASGQYCLKYMRKGSDDDCFMLASRRRGIGYKFAAQLIPAVMKHPDLTSISIPVRKTSKGNTTTSVVQRGLPSYFKRILYPTLSVLFPNEVTQAVKNFMDSATKLQYLFRDIRPDFSDKIVGMVDYVADKYNIMHIDFDDARPHRSWIRDVDQYIGLRNADGRLVHGDMRRQISVVRPVVKDGCLDPVCETYLSPGSDALPYKICRLPFEWKCVLAYHRQDICSLIALFYRSFRILRDYDYDINYFLSRLAVTEQHQDYVRSLDLPDVDIKNAVENYERDQRWIETNWMTKEIG